MNIVADAVSVDASIERLATRVWQLVSARVDLPWRDGMCILALDAPSVEHLVRSAWPAGQNTRAALDRHARTAESAAVRRRRGAPPRAASLDRQGRLAAIGALRALVKCANSPAQSSYLRPAVNYFADVKSTDVARKLFAQFTLLFMLPAVRFLGADFLTLDGALTHEESVRLRVTVVRVTVLWVRYGWGYGMYTVGGSHARARARDQDRHCRLCARHAAERGGHRRHAIDRGTLERVCVLRARALQVLSPMAELATVDENEWNGQIPTTPTSRKSPPLSRRSCKSTRGLL